MKNPKLEAQKRKILGRKVKKLRAEGVLPANIYGKKVKSAAIQVDLKEFEKIYREAGETGIINLKVKGEQKSRPVLVHNLQLDPVTDLPLHADFRQIKLKEKTTVEVPVELVGEALAEKEGVGILVTLLNSLEVEAFPSDLPEKLEVDVSKLEKVDDVVRIKDIKIDEKKIKIKAGENEIVAKIEPRAKEEEVAPPPAEEKPVDEEAPKEVSPEEAKPEGKKVPSEKKKPGTKEEKVKKPSEERIEKEKK